MGQGGAMQDNATSSSCSACLGERENSDMHARGAAAITVRSPSGAARAASVDLWSGVSVGREG